MHRARAPFGTSPRSPVALTSGTALSGCAALSP